MVSKKKIQDNRVSNAAIIIGFAWTVVAIILLLANHTQESVALFLSLAIGATIISLGICIRQAKDYVWLPVFVILGGVLMTLLTYLVYACLYFVIVNK